MNYIKNRRDDFYFYNDNRENKVNYEGLIKIAKIVTNDDEKLVNDINELVFLYENFCKKRKEFCCNIVKDFEDIFDYEKYLPICFGYWLSGARSYNKLIYSAYIGWDMKVVELLELIQSILDTLNIDIYILDLKVINSKIIEEVFSDIDEYLKKNHYSLLKMQVEKNVFFIYVVPIRSLLYIKSLGYDMNIDFNDDF